MLVGQVEAGMVESVRGVCAASLAAYAQRPRAAVAGPGGAGGGRHALDRRRDGRPARPVRRSPCRPSSVH